MWIFSLASHVSLTRKETGFPVFLWQGILCPQFCFPREETALQLSKQGIQLQALPQEQLAVLWMER